MRPGERDSSRETHSWRGWPTPAHSPIRPPPSTRRAWPAIYVVANGAVNDDDQILVLIVSPYLPHVVYLCFFLVLDSVASHPVKIRSVNLGPVAGNYLYLCVIQNHLNIFETNSKPFLKIITCIRAAITDDEHLFIQKKIVSQVLLDIKLKCG